MEFGTDFGIQALQKLEIMKTQTRNKVIDLINDMVKTGHENFAIGITGDHDLYFKLNQKHEMAMLSVPSHTMLKAAWKHFGETTMMQLPPIGKRAKYLYLFRIDGQEFKPPMF